MSQFDFGGFDFDFSNQGDSFAFADGNIDPFAGLPQPQQATQANLTNFFQQQGERVTPSGDITDFRSFGSHGIGGFGATSQTTRSSVTDPQNLQQFLAAQPGAREQLSGALAFDIGNRQAAARRQFNRNQQEIEGFRTTLGEGVDQLIGTADATAERVVGGAEDDRADLLARLDRIENQFVDRTDQDLGAAVGGIERRFRNTQKLIEAGVKPDGTPMTAQEQQEFAQRMTVSRQQEVTQAQAQIRSRFNETRAQLGVQLAGLADQANQQVQAARATSSGIRNAARLQALQLELGGRAQLAELVRNNRESVTSLFSSLAGLAQLQTSPGFGNVGSLV